mmetsp:Transcript_33986/g.83997  ORF Transcript_33986/g.83997 Transcript_33986/m.83997 type:complete len:223 (+) Transcript_33986:1238-1906(+)
MGHIWRWTATPTSAKSRGRAHIQRRMRAGIHGGVWTSRTTPKRPYGGSPSLRGKVCRVLRCGLGATTARSVRQGACRAFPRVGTRRPGRSEGPPWWSVRTSYSTAGPHRCHPHTKPDTPQANTSGWFCPVRPPRCCLYVRWRCGPSSKKSTKMPSDGSHQHCCRGKPSPPSCPATSHATVHRRSSRPDLTARDGRNYVWTATRRPTLLIVRRAPLPLNRGSG